MMLMEKHLSIVCKHSVKISMKKNIIRNSNNLFNLIGLMIPPSAMLAGCGKRGAPQQLSVVIYTSLDKVFSQPILESFEVETGIKVLTVYNSEATKTTGLVNRLIAEKDNPQADVFWNFETVRTVGYK